MNNDEILLQILKEVQETNTRVTNLDKEMKNGFEKVNARVIKLERDVKDIDLTVVEIFNMLKQQEGQNKNEIDKIKEKHEVISQVLVS